MVKQLLVTAFDPEKRYTNVLLEQLKPL